MSENSLFAILLRSPWWISFAIAAALALLGRALLPVQYAYYAWSIALPLAVVGAMAAWKQWQLPGEKQIAATVSAVSAMPWREFSTLIEKAYQRDGFAVTRLNGAADFRLVKAGRTTIVCGKRWKAASHGLEPLRASYSSRKAMEAQEAIYVAVGRLSENAVRFADDHRIVLMQGAELAALLRL
jgi:restriction system protein